MLANKINTCDTQPNKQTFIKHFFLPNILIYFHLIYNSSNYELDENILNNSERFFYGLF